ncbi:related to CSL4 - exosome core component [Melanopsichium pennsylvanicum]|uniref:Related to CSL4 - exosome core component n=2 Tax=Melanopsichium pennsylvanicum TaxID=63383 RepID=A0AAJ5C4V9_9BASI|nr:related to CSL4-exosome core component [Melanopsichium pennsylvanicum 4]SNX84090.1 related to CSL4 - exosome core component [Melanopsichium pennsylvanicum]
MASSSIPTTRRLLLPGQPLSVTIAPKSALELGPGTYTRGHYVLSSLVGYESRNTITKTTSSSSSSALSTSAKQNASTKVDTLSVSGQDTRFVVPKPDSIVIARVTRVTPRQAHLSILIIDGLPCGSSSSTSSTFVQCGLGNHAAGEGEGVDFQGIVRSQDVRSTEKDKVKISDCFRPGDIVRASVISLGDARSYYLSTAGNEFGVIFATSATSTCATMQPWDSVTAVSTATAGAGWNSSGNPMVPISWNQMIDPLTGIVENRKCAKPDGI